MITDLSPEYSHYESMPTTRHALQCIGILLQLSLCGCFGLFQLRRWRIPSDLRRSQTLLSRDPLPILSRRWDNENRLVSVTLWWVTLP